MKILDLPQGCQEWLDWRKGKKMASEAAAACGMSPYTKPAQLARQKRGLDSVFVNSAMSRGTQYEPEARSWYEAKAGEMGNPVVVELADFGASLDWWNGEMLAEFKVPSSEKAALWIEVQAGSIPLQYQYQMTQQMAVTGTDRCDFCVYLPEAKEGVILPYQFSSAMWEQIRSGWLAFWEVYMTGDLPDEYRSDSEWFVAASEYLSAKRKLEDAEKVVEEARNKLITLAPNGDQGAGVQLIKATREGSIPWAKAVEKLGIDKSQFEAFRGKSTSYYTVKEQA